MALKRINAGDKEVLRRGSSRAPALNHSPIRMCSHVQVADLTDREGRGS